MRTRFVAVILFGLILSCRPTKTAYYPPSDNAAVQDYIDAVEYTDDGLETTDLNPDKTMVTDVQGEDTYTDDNSDIELGEGIPVVQCTQDSECADFIQYGDEQCVKPVCDNQGICALKPINEGSVCDPKDTCVLNAVCKHGKCKGITKDCDDGNPCTTDLCDPEKGCMHIPNTGPCDDGNACTTVDLCQAGKCMGFNNKCQCETDADCLAVDDNNKCNGVLECSDEGNCVLKPGSIVQCPDTGDPCMENQCQPDTGECVPVPVKDGVLCDDHDICSNIDECISGKCVGIKALDCNDHDECTVDSCDPEKGCQHEILVGNPCDDGNACTTGDTCTPDGCTGKPIPGCGCTKKEDCRKTFLEKGGNLCQSDFACLSGQCKIIPKDEPVKCPESDEPCMASQCNPTTGDCELLKLPDNRSCDDGNPCTTNGICVDGKCKSTSVVCDTPPKNLCEDSNTLKVWSDNGVCNPDTGECEYSFESKTCDYACMDGTCVSQIGLLQGQSIPMGPETMSGSGFHVKCAADWMESVRATGNGVSLTSGYSAKK